VCCRAPARQPVPKAQRPTRCRRKQVVPGPWGWQEGQGAGTEEARSDRSDLDQGAATVLARGDFPGTARSGIWDKTCREQGTKRAGSPNRTVGQNVPGSDIIFFSFFF